MKTIPEAPSVDEIMRWEAGEMETFEEVVDFFQRLKDSGAVRCLQGSYGRTLAALEDSGDVR